MSDPFHDESMLDDALLVDALTAIEYMSTVPKDAISDAGNLELEPTRSELANAADVAPANSLDATAAATAQLLGEHNSKDETKETKTDMKPESLEADPLALPTDLHDISTKVEIVPATEPPKETTRSPYLHVTVTKESGLLGFGVVPVKAMCGIQVSTIQPDSSAAKAGLQVGDVLLKLNSKDVSAMPLPSIIQILQAVEPGNALHIFLFRPSIGMPMPKPLATDSLQPPAKKPKTHTPEYLVKKQVETLTKDLQTVTAEKDKLSEKNASLRKKVQQMVISADEARLKIKAEYDQKIASLTAEKTALQTTIATLQAQARLDSRAVFDTTITTDMKVQLDALQRQVTQFEELDKKRKETQKAHLQLELKLADKHRRQLLVLIVDKVSAELKSISQVKAQSSLRNNAFGSTGLPVHVKIQLELVRRIAVQRLFGLQSNLDSLGFPALTPVQVQLNENQLTEIFGKQLVCEERAGLNLVAKAPMDIHYDPTSETLSLQCKWTEQNIIREIARSIRM
ncbi:hypothetical protein AC1031_009490 [Aphanomyces cochlioides]|nr:hypothetical protein AC1031_009490 [Aphanomyces cochlioides]